MDNYEPILKLMITSIIPSGVVYVLTADIHIDGDTYFGDNFANTSGGEEFFAAVCSVCLLQS